VWALEIKQDEKSNDEMTLSATFWCCRIDEEAQGVRIDQFGKL